LKKLEVRTTQSAEARVSCSEVRGWPANQGASCGALQLEEFNPSDGKGLEGDKSLPPLCCNLSPLCRR